MQRILSTYRYASQALTPELLASIARSEIPAIEVFCSPPHFNYADPQSIRGLAESLNRTGLTIHALNAPIERDTPSGRGSGIPISIADPERIRRLDAVDETKRALDVAEKIPFRHFVQHLATGRQDADPRRMDAAFTSLEDLSVFARQRGVTIALQNTPNELGSPASLAKFLKETHLSSLSFCFDIGHAHMEGGVEEGFQLMRDHVACIHVHDNHGEKDEHLLPGEGSVDWDAAFSSLAGASDPVPLVLEVKELSPGKPSLDDIRSAFDRLEKQLEEKGVSLYGSGPSESSASA